MSFAETAKLVVDLSLAGNFASQMKASQKALTSFDTKLDQTGNRAYKAGQQIGTGIKAGVAIAATAIGLLASQVGFGLRQLVQLEGINEQTVAGLESTKHASGQTAASIRDLAEEYENLNAVIDDKVIQSGENVLLTFTNIRKEAFEPALEAALNLSVAMKQDLQTSVVQVGKALNDPAKGFAALRRVGIQFTADQEKLIKSLQASGDLLGAQKVILQELGTEFGGRFAAQGKSAEGTIAGIGDAVEDLQKSLATALFPTVQRLLPQLRSALTSPEFLRGVSMLGDQIASLFSPGNIRTGTEALTSLFNTAKAVAPVLQRAAEVTGQVIGTAVNAFRSLPPEIQALAVAGFAVNKLTGGLVTNIAGGLISAVISSFKGLMNVNAAVVNVNGGVGGVPSGVASAAAGALGISAAAVAALIAAPVVIAGVGLLVTKLADPTGARALAGKAATASARGIPDANNKPLRELEQLNKVADHTFDSIEKLRSGTQLVDVANAGAIGDAVSAATRRAIITADQKARGLPGTGKRSTTIAPRLAFLGAGHSGSRDVAVADALAQGFESSKSPAFKSVDALKAAIKGVSKDITTLPPKFAGPLGKDLSRLKTELARRTEKATRDAATKTSAAATAAGIATARAVDKKDLSVTIPIANNTYFNGRQVASNLSRYTTVVNGQVINQTGQSGI